MASGGGGKTGLASGLCPSLGVRLVFKSVIRGDKTVSQETCEGQLRSRVQRTGHLREC